MLKKIFTRLCNCGLGFYFTVVLLLVFFDVLNFRSRDSVLEFSLPVYLLSVLHALLVLVTVNALASLHKLGRRILAGSISVYLIASFYINYLLYQEFGEYLTPHMLRFVLTDRAYLRDYFYTYLHAPQLSILGLAFVGLWALILAIMQPFDLVKRRLFGIILLAMAVAFVLANQLRVLAKGEHLDSLTTTLVTTQKYFRQDWTSKRLQASERPPVAAVDVPKFNVLLIINESWDRTILPQFGGSAEKIPKLQQRLISSAKNFFIFNRAFANSGATDVSMPSILTGVGPQESHQKLHSMPLLWDLAKAAGMHTAFVSSQRLSWNNLDTFLNNEHLDYFVTAKDFSTPPVNDLGVDDLLSAEKLCDTVRQFKDSKSFIVYNSNAMHAPGQTTSTHLSVQPGFKKPMDKATFILDAAMDKIFNCYEQFQLLENTIIFMTADHGNGGFKARSPRLYSFFDEALNIPFMVYLPTQWQAAFGDLTNKMQKNLNINISNLDIAPTLAEILRLKNNPHNIAFINNYEGKSLFGNLPSHRFIIALNTNDVKKMDYEGFGVYQADWRLVLSDLYGFGLYDIGSDPDQKKNIWSTIAPDMRKRFTDEIEKNFHLKRIYSHQHHKD